MSLIVLLNDIDSCIYPLLAFVIRYLQKEKVTGPEANTFYGLAERALDEPVNERLKEYISQVYSLAIVFHQGSVCYRISFNLI